MDLKAYSHRLWQGRVAARENVKFFVPIWLFFAFAIYVELRRLDERVLLFMFFPVFIISSIPFFLRRVGLMRWWIFGGVLPAMTAAIILQVLRWSSP